MDVGGGIFLPVAETVAENLWSANYGGFFATQGIATMADGDIDIKAGGRFFAPVGTFGKGDLSIAARGDMDGRFLNTEGKGALEEVSLGKVLLSSMGSFGMVDESAGQVVEAFASNISVNAQGNVKIGSVVNPTIAGAFFGGNTEWDLRYSQDSSVSLHAGKGDVRLTGILDGSLGFKDTKPDRFKNFCPAA